MSTTGEQNKNAPHRFDLAAFLLPIIVSALEACWLTALIIGLVLLHFFGMQQPALPLWGPLLLMVSACAITRIVDQKQTNVAFLLLPGIACIVLWGNVYGEETSFFTFTWFLDALNQLLLLSPRGYAVASTLILSCGLYYRAITIARSSFEPSQIRNELFIGGTIFIVTFLFQTQSSIDRLHLLILLLLFATLVALARALSHVAFIRQSHLIRFAGNNTTHDRLVLTIVGIMCLVMVSFTTLVGITTDRRLLAELQRFVSPIYTLFTSLIAGIGVILLAPIIWFLDLIHFQTPTLRGLQAAPTPQVQPTPPALQQPTPTETAPAIINIQFLIGLGSLVLLLVVIVLLIRNILRKRKRRQDSTSTRFVELHESLWSWQLFWAQLRGLFISIWRRIRGLQDEDSIQKPAEKKVSLEGVTPEARNIRELYRIFLQGAAQRGYGRQKEETPVEFQGRLASQSYVSEEHALADITETYNSVRYGETIPEATDIARMQQHVNRLQQS